MKIVVKLVVWVVGIVVVAVAGLSIWANLFFDAEAVKGQLTTAVEAETGHRLTINEPLALSVFPRLGVETGGVTLHAQEAGSAPLAEVRHLSVKVALLPLLLSNLEADQIVVDGLQLNLRRDQQGHGNWESLLPSHTGAKRAPSTSGKVALGTISMGGIDIRDAGITWEDLTTASHTVVSQLNLKSGPIRWGEAVSLAGGLAYQQNQDELSGTLQFSGALLLTDQLETITLQSLSIQAESAGQSMPNGRPLTASLEGRVVVKEKGKSVTLDELTIQLDQTTLRGQLSLQHAKPEQIRFNLQGDQLDLDRYLPEGQGAVEPVAGSAAGVVQLPVELLRQLDVEGGIHLDSLKMSGAEATAVDFQLSIKEGQVSVGPLSAQLYGGTYQGTVGIDVNVEPVQVALQESLTRVDLGRLLKERSDVEAMRGLLSAEGDFRVVGITTAEMMDSVDGNARVEVTEGAIQGVNLRRLIRQAQALLERKPLPTGSEPNETRFEDLKATVHARDGRLTSDNLVMRTSLMEIRGAGWVELKSGQMEYRLNATVAESLTAGAGEGLERLSGKSIPILLHGTLDNPKVKVDLEDLLKDSLQKKLKKKLGNLLGGGESQSEGGNSEEKMRQGFGNLLNKLF
ncbi:MAG: AsmA family protein [Gammaproteobacteria bacterium]|jgi:AsmA protein|nr:AsmA family protein [Gammaproteobacteria bacterium]